METNKSSIRDHFVSRSIPCHLFVSREGLSFVSCSENVGVATMLFFLSDHARDAEDEEYIGYVETACCGSICFLRK